MRWDAGGVDQPLYLVFPDFIAHYAAWGEKKHAHIGEEEWQDEAFGACEEVALAVGDPPAELTFEIEPISARCVEVLVENIPADELVAVELMAYDGDTDRLDNLHLTASRMSSTVGELTFDCYDEAAEMGPTVLCLHKPFTGAKGRTLTPSDGGGVAQAPSGLYVKTWLGVPQIAGGGRIANTYFVVHTPVQPRDADHDVQKGGRPQSVRLQVGLERSKITLAAGPTTASASVNGTRDSAWCPCGVATPGGTEGRGTSWVPSPPPWT